MSEMDNQQLRHYLRYKKFIDYCKVVNGKTQVSDYYERHHIIPKCLGGNDSHENLISLTGRQHFIAHKILTKCYPDNYGINLAFYTMSMVNKKTNKARINLRINSRDFESLKKARSKAISSLMKGNQHFKGKIHSKEHKEKVSQWNRQRKEKFGYYHTEDGLENIKKSVSISNKLRWELLRFCKAQRPGYVMNLLQTTVHNKLMIVEAPNISLKLMMIWSELM